MKFLLHDASDSQNFFLFPWFFWKQHFFVGKSVVAAVNKAVIEVCLDYKEDTIEIIVVDFVSDGEITIINKNTDIKKVEGFSFYMKIKSSLKEDLYFLRIDPIFNNLLYNSFEMSLAFEKQGLDLESSRIPGEIEGIRNTIFSKTISYLKNPRKRYKF